MRAVPSDSHVAPTPGTPGCGNAPVPSQPRPGPGVVRGRTAAFSSFPSRSGPGAGRGITGAQWPSTAGAGAPVLHPPLIAAAGAAARTLLCPHAPELPAHCWCPGLLLPGAGAGPTLPCLSRLALGTRCHPWGKAPPPTPRGTRWGRGVFHRVFHMLAPAVSPLCPQPRPPAPHPAPLPAAGPCFPQPAIGTGQCCSCANHSAVTHPALHGHGPVQECCFTGGTEKELLHPGWFLSLKTTCRGEGRAAHQGTGQPGSGTRAVGQGRTAAALCPSMCSVTWGCSGHPQGGSTPPFCRGSCHLLTHGGLCPAPPDCSFSAAHSHAQSRGDC